ncbi:MAG: aminotransferase class IV [Planctomycetota bacterium]|jgi:branched-subunit amino acid aminotransferase/4-amino-4-deoxychorismate lyase
MDGVFTTIRVVNGRPWFGDAHARRLGVDPRLLDRVGEAAGDLADSRVRVTRVEGSGPLPWQALIEARAYVPPQEPWRLAPVRVDAPPEAVRRKTTDRGYYDAARARAGAADEALLHLGDGTLLECTIANILFVADGRLVTPDATLPLLAGIARGLLLDAARALGLAVEEGRPTLEDLRTADECMVSNALLIAHPVAEIAGLARFRVGETARRLRDYVVANNV